MQNKLPFYVVGGLVILLGLGVLSVYLGAYDFHTPLWAVFKNGILGKPPLHSSDHFVLFNIRLPRIVMGVLIGSALAVSGTCLQGMFKNPLATPNLIGVTAGASLFAALAIVLGSTFHTYLPEVVQYSLIGIMAFLGAIITMVFVYRVSTTRHRTNVVVMLLAGVAISALSGAITGFMIYLTDDQQLRDLTFWTLGSLGGASWLKNGILVVVILGSYLMLINQGKALNAMMLGEKDAAHLGIPIESLKKRIIILSALLVGTCVAFAGAIGFVGLIVPYILRLVFKSNYHIILPLSAVLGSILLLSADTFSRTIVAPSEMPIGILTAFLGAPVFIAILIRFKKTL